MPLAQNNHNTLGCDTISKLSGKVKETRNYINQSGTNPPFPAITTRRAAV